MCLAHAGAYKLKKKWFQDSFFFHLLCTGVCQNDISTMMRKWSLFWIGFDTFGRKATRVMLFPWFLCLSPASFHVVVRAGALVSASPRTHFGDGKPGTWVLADLVRPCGCVCFAADVQPIPNFRDLGHNLEFGCALACCARIQDLDGYASCFCLHISPAGFTKIKRRWKLYGNSVMTSQLCVCTSTRMLHARTRFVSMVVAIHRKYT